MGDNFKKELEKAVKMFEKVPDRLKYVLRNSMRGYVKVPRRVGGMKKVIYYEGGAAKFFFYTDKEGEELKKEMAKMTGVKEILIKGQGFWPVSNAQHFAAAGLYDEDVDESVLKQPAHFNPPFFDIQDV